MEAKKLKEILDLSKEEKIELVHALCVNIEEEYLPDLTTEHIKIIKERFEMIDNDETELRDWDEVKKKYIKFD